MMTAQEESLAARFIDALAKGDSPTALGLLADDATWTFPGDFEYSGTHVGKKAIVEQMMTPAGALFAPPPQPSNEPAVTVHTMVTQGERVAVEFTSRLFTATGKRYKNDYVMMMRVESGRIKEVREYTDTSYLRQTCY